MTTGRARVLIFEDDDDSFGKLVTALTPRLTAIQAEPDRFKAQGSDRPEKEVVTAIQREPAASLVVLDCDLTKYTDTAVSRHSCAARRRNCASRFAPTPPRRDRMANSTR